MNRVILYIFQVQAAMHFELQWSYSLASYASINPYFRYTVQDRAQTDFYSKQVYHQNVVQSCLFAYASFKTTRYIASLDCQFISVRGEIPLRYK